MAALRLTSTKTHLLWEVHHRGPCAQQRLAEGLGVSARTRWGWSAEEWRDDRIGPWRPSAGRAGIWRAIGCAGQ